MRSTTEEALRQLQQQDQAVLLQRFLESCNSMEQFEEDWTDLMQLMRQRRYLISLPEREQMRRKIIQLLDEGAWKRAQAEGTKSAYLDYLRAFATPKHQNEAQAALARIDQEHEWHQARLLGTVDALRTFLLNFPESVHGPEAQEQLRHLAEVEDQRFRQVVAEAWQHAKQTATVESYRTFLLEYPDSGEAEEARQLLVRQEKMSWKRVKQSEGSAVVEALQAYLQQFPDGPMEGQARQRLTDCLRENLRAKPASRSLRRRYLEVRTEKGRQQDSENAVDWFFPVIGYFSAALSFWPATYIYYWIVGYGLPDILAVLAAFLVFFGVWMGGLFLWGITLLIVLMVVYREPGALKHKVKEKVTELGPLPFWDAQVLSLETLRKKYLGDEALDTPTPTATRVT